MGGGPERGDARGEYLRLDVELDRIQARVQALQPRLDPEWVLSLSSPKKVQVLPGSTRLPRVETGALQVGTNWPGLFIRGDEAQNLMLRIRQMTGILGDHPDAEVSNVLGLLTSYAGLIDEQVIVR